MEHKNSSRLADLEAAFVATLNEKQKRFYAGLRASELGYYGVARVAGQLKLHPHTVRCGQKQLALAVQSGEPVCGRVRRVGGGRKKSVPATRDCSRV